MVKASSIIDSRKHCAVPCLTEIGRIMLTRHSVWKLSDCLEEVSKFSWPLESCLLVGCGDGKNHMLNRCAVGAMQEDEDQKAASKRGYSDTRRGCAAHCGRTVAERMGLRRRWPPEIVDGGREGNQQQQHGDAWECVDSLETEPVPRRFDAAAAAAATRASSCGAWRGGRQLEFMADRPWGACDAALCAAEQRCSTEGRRSIWTCHGRCTYEHTWGTFLVSFSRISNLLRHAEIVSMFPSYQQRSEMSS